MTASTLLLYIGMALMAQIMLGIAYALLKRRATARLPAPSPAISQPGVSPLAWIGLKAFRVAKRSFEDAAQTQCSFYLEPVDGLPLPPFKPGQYLTFSLPLPALPGGATRTVTRCYSLSDSPEPGYYRVTIKRVPAPTEPSGLPPGLASNYFHDHIHTGDTLQLRAPAGHFHLDTATHTPVVLIAGGIGITPMLSMLRWCAQHQPERAVHLYYGVRNSAEQAYKALLEDMAVKWPQFTLHVVYSNPLTEDQHRLDYQHAGRVNLDLLKLTLPHGPHQFYICGPTAMLESLVPALVEWGVATSDIHFEAFGPASVRLPAQEAMEKATLPVDGLQIQFTRSGRSLAWNAKYSNLLDFAEAHGIQIESGCRSGSCGSCVTTLAEGSVDYANPPDYEVAPGHCLLCVAKPRTPLTLEA
ncbi:2Fe-2S iron-sulfur cluster-binding protein [Rhodoferax sp. GW822-FHT02A01]|uniref:2Fe-2S iron-sulfur cluster-binding protein n=1 Tax=Rhodoferax sp. GW822-FHT02A01 TaxID=3141537 RepID=UPI00315CE8AA